VILAVRSNQPQFKNVTFTSGFNVIMAERTKESTRKDSCNGLGKSTLINIIDFCLGSNGKLLMSYPLAGWTFSIDIDLRGKRYTVHRSLNKIKEVEIEGDFSDWPIKPHFNRKTGNFSMSVRNWNLMLGYLMFDLPLNLKEQKYTPSFRSLISYFIRKTKDSYITPFEHFRKQSSWQKQVDHSFLLGLSWQDASEWQVLKEQEKILRELRKATKSGLITKYTGSIGKLEAEKVRLEEKAKSQEAQLSSFRVHPQYHEIENEVNDLTSEIHQLTNQNIADREMLRVYESNLEDESPADESEVIKLYDEAGAVLSDKVKKTIIDVQQFHRQIAINRKQFLEVEINRLKEKIARREEKIRVLSNQRASNLSILKTHGALDEYTKLQQRHVDLRSKLEEIKAQIENLKKFEQGTRALRIAKEELQIKASMDYEDRSVVRERAVALFGYNSEALYDTPGTLIIDIDENGYKFDVEIERASSDGVSQMKIFCYDLMLAQLWSGFATSPNFLIHDSLLFGDVDPRQVTNALQLAHQEAMAKNFQYICCLNSDLIPWSMFDAKFNLNAYVRLRLTDAYPEGSLLGFRF
jgi:uncharacterized protein YydD (DUF2326 family)